MQGVKLNFCQARLQCRAAVHSPVTASLPVTYCRNLFFLCLFLKRNNPAASFTQRTHLASEELGWQSFTSCICSGKDIWLSFHTPPFHGLLLVCLLIWPSMLLCFRWLGPWLTISFHEGEKMENKTQQAHCSCTWFASIKLPVPRKEIYLSFMDLEPVFSQQMAT